MRYLKCTIIAALLISLLLGLSVAAFASEEETDWSQVDWSQVNLYEVDWNAVDWENTDIRAMFRRMFTYDYLETFNDFYLWMLHEADLQDIFLIGMYTDAASSEACATVLYERFKLDPYGWIQLLAQENSETQKEAVRKLCYGGYPPDEFSQVLGSVQLPDTATEEEVAIWQAILDYAEQYWNVIPATGDIVFLPVALLLASTAGLALLLSIKKRFLA